MPVPQSEPTPTPAVSPPSTPRGAGTSATGLSAGGTQVEAITDRLALRYTADQISHRELEARVSGFYHQFDAVRIRAFVAIFVERLVRRTIDRADEGVRVA